MTGYSYKTVAAPRRLKKIKGVKGKDALLAQTIEDLIAIEAAQGWEYQRADSFPVEEKSGLFSKSSVEMRAVLVFRKAIAAQRPQPQHQPAPQPVAAAPAPRPAVQPQPAQPQPAPPQPEPPQPAQQRPEPSLQEPVAQPPRGPSIGGAND